MARKAARKPARKPARKAAPRTARKAPHAFDEKALTKGQLRKLNALRKSLGEEIADKAFAEWLETVGEELAVAEDKNAILIAEALEPLVLKNKLKIPRGGYLVRRGRKRVIVEQLEYE